MLLDFDAFREVYLVFMNTNYPGAWIFKDGFRHVYVIERQALGWICIDPSKSDTYAHILPASYHADVISEFIKQNPSFTVLHLHVRPHMKRLYPAIGILSCVSLVQYMLGIYWPHVFTPWQLYCKIISDTPKHIEVIKCHHLVK